MAHTTPLSSSSDNHYITLREAVDRGYGAYSTIRAWIAAGRLPAVKIGGRVKLKTEDLDALAKPTGGAWQHKPSHEQVLDAAVDAVVARAPKLSAAQAARLATVLGGAA